MLTSVLSLRAIKMLFPAAGILLILFASVPSTQAVPEEKLLRHVVLFRFKEGTTPQQVKQVEDAFRALPTKINLIRGFEWAPTSARKTSLRVTLTASF